AREPRFDERVEEYERARQEERRVERRDSLRSELVYLRAGDEQVEPGMREASEPRRVQLVYELNDAVCVVEVGNVFGLLRAGEEVEPLGRIRRQFRLRRVEGRALDEEGEAAGSRRAQALYVVEALRVDEEPQVCEQRGGVRVEEALRTRAL